MFFLESIPGLEDFVWETFCGHGINVFTSVETAYCWNDIVLVTGRNPL